MNKKTMKRQRRALWGWIKWVPVVSIPFSILFFHTWLNIQILRADYTLRELDGEARELADRLNDTGVAEATREDPNMLSEQAKLMDFEQPSPGQRESIPWRQLTYPEESTFAVAQVDGAAQPDPGATESLTDQAKAETAPTHEAVAEASTAAAESPAPAETPVAVTVEENAPVDGAVPAPMEPNAVLNQPEAPETEDVADLESAMDSLESL